MLSKLPLNLLTENLTSRVQGKIRPNNVSSSQKWRLNSVARNACNSYGDK